MFNTSGARSARASSSLNDELDEPSIRTVLPQVGIAAIPNIGQDNAMNTEPFRIEVTKARVSWTGIVLDLISAASGGNVSSYSGTHPRIVIYNLEGKRRVLERAATEEEARLRAAEIERDYQLLSTATWCNRYNVPVSFISNT